MREVNSCIRIDPMLGMRGMGHFPNVDRGGSPRPLWPLSRQREEASPTITQEGSVDSPMARDATFPKVSWCTAAATKNELSR